MTPEFTLILPHKRNPGNDAALAICLDMLAEHTVNDYILLMDAATDRPLYPRVNRLFELAPTELCIYWASDMFPGPGWDVALLEAWDCEAIVCPTVCEPGAIAMWAGNHPLDLGRTPETFDRQAFEQWCLDGGHFPQGKPWFAPYLISKQGFWEMGGLGEDYLGEFTKSDVDLFDRWEQAGRRIVRARGSWVYHLQRYSDLMEQEKRR